MRTVERQVAGIEKLRSAGPEAVGQLCSLIAWAAIGWAGAARQHAQQLGDALGVDIDLRFIRTVPITQGNLTGAQASRLAIESELVRCNDTI